MMKLFTKAESHYMTYEIAHIAAVNMVAALCHAWKPKYLIHENPLGIQPKKPISL